MPNYTLQRRNMVESQVRPSDIADRRILRALEDIPREAFVPSEHRPLAYMDGPIALTPKRPGEPFRALLPPRTFAKLIDGAMITPDDAVLDVGCATGYSAAVIARLARTVVALESDVALATEASATLAAMGLDNVTVVAGELAHGHGARAPYDVIVLEGSVERIPAILFEQLGEGGRLVAVTSEDGLERATLWRRAGHVFGKVTMFDAAAPILPGFGKTTTFVF